MHNASKVKMGIPRSSDKVEDVWDGNPANFLAGCAVRNNAGALSKTTGEWIGVSAGKSLSDTSKVNMIRAGSQVPMECTDLKAKASIKKGDITFEAVEYGADGNSITVAALDTKSDGSCEVTVEGTDIVLDIEAAVTTAATIKAAIEASDDASALITATIDEGETETAQAAFAEDALEDGRDSVDYLVIGGMAYINDTTGLVDDPAGQGVTISNATIVSGELTGIREDGTDCLACIVDMPGGL